MLDEEMKGEIMKKTIVAIILTCVLISPIFANELGQKGNTISWDEWINSEEVLSYFGKINVLMAEEARENAAIRQRLKQDSDSKKASSELKDLTFKIQAKLKQLKPPKELEIFHQKKIKGLEYANLATIAAFENNKTMANYHLKRMAEILLETDEELRRAYSDLGAPKEIIIEIDKEIKKDKERLKN